MKYNLSYTALQAPHLFPRLPFSSLPIGWEMTRSEEEANEERNEGGERTGRVSRRGR